MGTIDPRDAIPLTDEGKRLQDEYRQRMKETLAEIPTFDAEQMRKDIIRIHSDAIHQMCGDPVQRSYVDALTERLAAAEQRASTAEGRSDRLADALEAIEGIAHPPGCTEQGIHDIWTIACAALTVPATQPDERAAAERANGDAQFLYTDDVAAEAWADDVALFILHKVTEATSLTLAEIAPNLTAPDGWLSFARLWRADFIIVTGDLVQPTERGIAAMRELLICVADVELDAADGAAKEET